MKIKQIIGAAAANVVSYFVAITLNLSDIAIVLFISTLISIAIIRMGG